MLKICLQLLLLSLVLNVWNQNFLEPMCPVNGNSRCCFIWGDFLIFFSFICSVPFSGAPVVLTGNIAYHSSQLYSDCLIALSFSSIFSEVRLLQKLYLYQHLNFQTYVFCFIFLLCMGFSSWNVFPPFFVPPSLFYCIHSCLSSIFWYFTLSPLLSCVCGYTLLHYLCVCVCVYSLTLESWNLSGELIKTHISGRNFRVFYLKSRR